MRLSSYVVGALVKLRLNDIGSWILVCLAIIAGIPVVLGIGVVEAILRFRALLGCRAGRAYEHVLLTPDPVLGYRNRGLFDSRSVPAEVHTLDYYGRITVTTDESGCRNVPWNRPDGTARTIVVLGDSSTFGWNLSDDATIPARMALHLNHKGSTAWRVINAGVNGFCTLQMFRLSMEILPKAEPDYVLVCSDWNTFFNTLRYRSLWSPGCIAGLAHSDLPDRYALSHWQTPRLLCRARLALGNARVRQQHGLEWLFTRCRRWKENRLYLESTPWRREMHSYLFALAAAARSCGAVPLFTTVAGLCHPSASDNERITLSSHASKHVASVRRGPEGLASEAFDFWADCMVEINSVVTAACTEHAVGLIDVGAAMERVRGGERASAFYDLFHYGSDGADIVSRKLAEEILSRNRRPGVQCTGRP